MTQKRVSSVTRQVMSCMHATITRAANRFCGLDQYPLRILQIGSHCLDCTLRSTLAASITTRYRYAPIVKQTTKNKAKIISAQKGEWQNATWRRKLCIATGKIMCFGTVTVLCIRMKISKMGCTRTREHTKITSLHCLFRLQARIRWEYVAFNAIGNKRIKTASTLRAGRLAGGEGGSNNAKRWV